MKCHICQKRATRTWPLSMPCCRSVTCHACLYAFYMEHLSIGFDLLPCIYCHNFVDLAQVARRVGLPILTAAASRFTDQYITDLEKQRPLIIEQQRRLQLLLDHNKMLDDVKLKLIEAAQLATSAKSDHDLKPLKDLTDRQRTLDTHIITITADPFCRTHFPTDYIKSLDEDPHLLLPTISQRLLTSYCTDPRCNGRIFNNSCSSCSRVICGVCEQTSNPNHVCHEADALSVQLLRQESRICPQCRGLLARYAICMYVTCDNCHLELNWTTMQPRHPYAKSSRISDLTTEPFIARRLSRLANAAQLPTDSENVRFLCEGGSLEERKFYIRRIWLTREKSKEEMRLWIAWLTTNEASAKLALAQFSKTLHVRFALP